jgi:hypothetical protein
MVPIEVMEPPVRPAPVLILVTVPLFGLVIVETPPTVDTEIPDPATMLVIPVFEIVTLPVLAVTLIPGPAAILVTPEPPPPEEVKIDVIGLKFRPEPIAIG